MNKETTILTTVIVGSHLHGLNGPDSDVDRKSVFLSPLQRVISPFCSDRPTHKVADGQDDVAWELSHFVKLITSGNPTVLEALWSPLIEVDHPVIADIRERRAMLLNTKSIIDAHRGYALSQIHRIERNGWNGYDDSRAAKLIVAYLRTLAQGRELISTGTFQPVATGTFRDLLMRIKFEWETLQEGEIERLVTDARVAFEAVVATVGLFTYPNYEGAERLLLDAYLKFVQRRRLFDTVPSWFSPRAFISSVN